MSHDSAPSSIFKISELTRLIASQLIVISPKSAVSLACGSRYLEEPVLSTLWEMQGSLCTLLEVLPGEVHNLQDGWAHRCVVRGPDLSSGGANAQVLIQVHDRGGSVTRGLEQDSSLRVLDAPRRGVRLASPCRGYLPQNAPQFTRWWMVPSVARFILDHHGIQPSLRRSILLPAFEDDFYLQLMAIEEP